MTVHAAIDAALPFLRAEAEARMASRATIKRKDPDNPVMVDGFEVPGWTVIYADLPFRLGGANQGSSGTRTASVGGVEVQLATRVGHLPHDTTGLRDEDVIEVVSGEQAGTFVRIVEAAGADQQTALRVPVVETQQPAGWSA